MIALSVLPIQIGLTILGCSFRRQFALRPKKTPRPKPSRGADWHSDGEGTERGDGQPLALAEFYSQYIARTFEKTITGTA